jgi:hypothetical protein
MKSIAERVDSLGPEQRKVFEEKLKKAGLGLPESATSLPVTGKDTRGIFPASYAQKRMYLIREIDEDSTAYNISNAWTIKGGADVPRLKESFRGLV